ncbi:MAG: hypothetical protein FWC10_06700 [Lentimicrobiaceae bacterium]|nr:hypothetical protein [Lentimicrobiaceae bacterium]
MKYYYIKKGLKRAAVFAAEPSNAGSTEQDYKNGKWIEVSESQADFYKENPTASFSEIISMEMIPPIIHEFPIEEEYKNLVVSKIREKYSIDDELAIQRKRDDEPLKFEEYDNFCEQCKLDAKQELELL